MVTRVRRYRAVRPRKRRAPLPQEGAGLFSILLRPLSRIFSKGMARGVARQMSKKVTEKAAKKIAKKVAKKTAMAAVGTAGTYGATKALDAL